MSNYSKTKNAMNNYNEAVININRAIASYKNAKVELSKIKGVESCEQLKKDIDNKINELSSQVKKIIQDKSKMIKQSKSLDQKELEKEQEKGL